MPAGFWGFGPNIPTCSRPASGGRTTEGFFTFDGGQGPPGRLAGLLHGRGGLGRALLLRHGSSLPQRLPATWRPRRRRRGRRRSRHCAPNSNRRAAPAAGAAPGTPCGAADDRLPLSSSAAKRPQELGMDVASLSPYSASHALPADRCLREGSFQGEVQAFVPLLPSTEAGRPTRVSLNVLDQIGSRRSRTKMCASDSLKCSLNKIDYSYIL